MVGDRQRAHPHLARHADERLEAVRAVEQGVLGMGVQVDEASRHAAAGSGYGASSVPLRDAKRVDVRN
jgi:hypothetical protein